MPDLEYYLAQARRIEEHREAQAEVGMRKAFKNLLKNLQGFLGEEYANNSEDGKLSYEILQKKARYARFIDEVEKKVIKGTEESSNIVKKTVDDTYKAAFDGMIDAVKKADGNSEELKKAFKSVKYVKPETLKKAVENPVSGLTLKDTLEKNRAEIVYNIKQTVGIGLQNGDRYETMAKRVAESLDGDYQKAIRIVRTETHRVQQAGKLESALAIDEKLKKGNSGMRYYKIWRTSKDERVRKPKGKNKANHRKMEGVTILVDEEFDLGHGVKAMAPGMSGDAGNDINCRCRLSFRLKKAEKDIEKPAENDIIKVEECQNINELSNYLDSKYTINVDDDVKKLNFNSVKKCLSGAEAVINEFPELGDLLENINVKSSGVMSCSGKEISFNGIYFDNENKLIDICKTQSESGFWIKNSSPQTLGVHEAAHGVENLLINLNSEYSYDFEKVLAWSNCTEASRIVTQACKNIKKTAYGKGKKKWELLEGISKYASKNASETMAEAFADVYANGKNANPLSIEIKRLTVEKYKNYKGGI